MNKIIIVGHPQSDIESVEQLLISSGMTPAQPSRRDGLYPQEIDATLIKAHGATPVELIQNAQQLQQIQVAPVWQGMVLDLMLSNLDQPLWGWADTQAVYLLDYWKEQDPKVVFVLVYDEPHTALTRLSLEEAAVSQEELQRRLDVWVAYNSALLHFHLRNSHRSVLVHAQQVKPSAERYLQHLSERITTSLELSGLELSDSYELSPVTSESDTVTTVMVDAQMEVLTNLLMQANPQAQTLYAELQAGSTLPANLESQGAMALAEPSGTYYRAWQACIVQQQYIQDLTQRIQKTSIESSQLHARIEGLQKNIEDLQKKLDNAYQQAQTQQLQHKHVLQVAEQSAQAQLKEQAQLLADAQSQQQQAARENELLLTQLHQAQEESAHYHHYYQINKEQVLVIDTAKSELLAKSKQLADIQKQLQISQAAERAAQIKLKDQVKEVSLIRSEMQAQAEQLVKAQSQLKQQGKLKGQKEKSEILALQKENSLLLIQLHQVQEELGRYHLENKKLKANQKPKPKIYYGAADRIKNQLSYRLGARMIEQSRSVGGWLTMPFALRAEVKRFRQDQAARKNEKLPPISQYGDAYEAERVKQHLSYRLGARMINNSRTLGGWLRMPWALRAEIKDFQKMRR